MFSAQSDGVCLVPDYSKESENWSGLRMGKRVNVVLVTARLRKKEPPKVFNYEVANAHLQSELEPWKSMGNRSAAPRLFPRSAGK